MESAEGRRILLRTPDPAASMDLRRSLEDAGYRVQTHTSGSPDLEPWGDCHLLVIDDGVADSDPAALCRRVRASLGNDFIPLLFVAGESPCPSRRVVLEAGADACLTRPVTEEEFLAQVNALLRIKDRHDRLQGKTAEMLHTTLRLQQAHQRVNQELELARRIQQSFLPQSLPEVPRARFAVHYQPCGRVGGDFYDVFRLDEQHIGFYVADAMGHGVPAGLLTMFLKKGVRAKEIFQKQYRLVPPEEVLERLNRDLIEQGLADNSFITMIYGLFNVQDGTLHFSRAGHPHPVYLSGDHEPEVWKVPGSLLGVFETTFADRTCRLRPGDKVLFYTDGTEELSFEGRPPGTESFLACLARHRNKPIAELVGSLASDLLPQAPQPDDFTVLGLEVKE
jgi:sigma-B regulation protein RsbU (phosphoserine phosphatase)